MKMKNLDVLIQRCCDGKKMKVAVACPHGLDTLEAACRAKRENIVDPVLVGDPDVISKIALENELELDGIEIVEASDDRSASEISVKMVSSGSADLLMKGLVKTATLLKAVLNKEWGLRTGSLLSHLLLFEAPILGDKVMGISDGGMNMYPDLGAKVKIIENAVECFHKLGEENPKIAVLAAVETVNPDMPCTIDAASLSQMNRRGQITGCVIDGPFALDNAISTEAAAIKKINSSVAGNADMLLVPDIEAGNMLAKVVLYIARNRAAGVVLGARSPIVMTSRFDTMEVKLLSIALGAVLAKEK